MNAFELAQTLAQPPSEVWVVIPPGLRKEETGAILAKALGWTSAQLNEWTNVDTVTPSDYFEGVYFPDSYLIPTGESPADAAKRLQAQFEQEFAPYAAEAAKQNIIWTTALKVASIIQREAAGPSDMPLVSGIIWNRLLNGMKLQVDSTVQYARGDTPTGWWAPIDAERRADRLTVQHRYLYAGLPPHPIDSPGLDAINAALNPASTTCSLLYSRQFRDHPLFRNLRRATCRTYRSIRSKFVLFCERVTGIEPVSQPWEGRVLPLNHTRKRRYCITGIPAENRI